MNWYILDSDGAVRGPVDVHEYHAWATPERCRVARDLGADVDVSTVFLGLDHSHTLTGPPVLFETMIFGGEWDQWQWRYVTQAEAKAGHAAIVAALAQGKALTRTRRCRHDRA